MCRRRELSKCVTKRRRVEQKSEKAFTLCDGRASVFRRVVKPDVLSPFSFVSFGGVRIIKINILTYMRFFPLSSFICCVTWDNFKQKK